MGDGPHRSSAGIGRNTVVNDIHRDMTGNHGAVGYFATNILKMCRRIRLGVMWSQKRGMVATGGAR